MEKNADSLTLDCKTNEGNDFYHRWYLECDCSSVEDTIRIVVETNDSFKAFGGEKREAYFQVQTVPYYSIYKRLAEAYWFLFFKSKVIKHGCIFSRYHIREYENLMKIFVEKLGGCDKEFEGNELDIAESEEHRTVIITDDFKDFNIAEMITYLNWNISFLSRFRLAVKHIFRYECRYGGWECFDFTAEIAKKIHDMLKKVKWEK